MRGIGWGGRSVALVGCLLVAGAGCAGAEPATGDPVVETRYFRFDSDPWINLHHFLYQWTRAELGLGQGRAYVPVPERDGPQPDGVDGEAWERALSFYRERVARRDHFDNDLLELKAAFLEMDGDPGAVPPDAVEGISRVLIDAMPVYLERWWPEHDRDNRRLVDHLLPDVRAEEERWVVTVTELFGGEWVEGKLRVDASAYANWQGGYTSNGPAHTVLWSRDESNLDGLYGLELLFHESGHASPLGAPLRRTVREILREEGVEEPGNLRHTLLFATAGWVVADIAAERGLPQHVPYIVAEGLTGFAGWAPLWPPVVEHWRPVVSGNADRLEALRALARALAG